MREDLFMEAFGSETNLRILMSLWKNGSSSLYRIKKLTGFDNRGQHLRESLANLVAAGLLETQIVTHVHRSKGHRRRAKSHDTTEYVLNEQHETSLALGKLFNEASKEALGVVH